MRYIKLKLSEIRRKFGITNQTEELRLEIIVDESAVIVYPKIIKKQID